MTSLADRLDAIAHLIDTLPGYTRDDARVWRELIRHIDRVSFERTGHIIVVGSSPKRIAAGISQTDASLTASMVEEVLPRLAARGHLVIEQDHIDGLFQYRLFLYHREEKTEAPSANTP